MRKSLLYLLGIIALLAVGCGGGSTTCQRPKVPVRIQAKVERVQGLNLADSRKAQGRSVGEIVSVWLTSPVEQRLAYDSSTYTAGGVVTIEVGQNIRFRVEAKRADGVTLYAGEAVASVTIEDRFKEIAVTLLPVPGSVDVSANVHEVTGPPTIRLTHIPPRFSYENLEGVVENINPALVAVAVYIEVDGRWWTKPYWTEPKTPVRGNGTWTCDITTGGYDESATKIRAYLIRKQYEPPLAPQQGLPPDPPTSDVLAMVEVVRE